MKPIGKKFLVFYLTTVTIAYVFPVLMTRVFNYPLKPALIIGLIVGISVSVAEVVLMSYKKRSEVDNLDLKPGNRKLLGFYIMFITQVYLNPLLMTGLFHEPLKLAGIGVLITATFASAFTMLMLIYLEKRRALKKAN